ncbi:TetR/AcrR family transcriptional regulator [Actinotalea subterranea]|uniref:TetR/AcrR family transcriptional regulator n=1 Tax=Actinotalea subterranea TaxID=2607497 RepID=UPI0011EBF5C0|nr:TetR/AcrR family transcriptional regulator [Actinotalea subterranea]
MAEVVQYRRGNLREAVLDRALTVLRERGADALSLRELARDVGVSHAAPARHFAGRRQLLDALAVAGFAMLADRLHDAVASDAGLPVRARRAADAYLDFAIGEANLVEVMFRHEDGRDATAIGRSATAAFAPLRELFPDDDDGGSAVTVFLAALQGIAGLVNCGVVPVESVPQLTHHAVSQLGPGPRDQNDRRTTNPS